MRTWTRITVAMATGLLALGLALPSGAQTTPTVTLDRTGTAAGEDLVVRGTGWPQGTTLVVELCGRQGRNGSVDCDVANQRVAGVAQDGAFRSSLTVGRPPAPCPCVVRVVDQKSPLVQTAPIAVQGMATVPLEEPDDPGPEFSITGVAVTEELDALEWFGAPPQRMLELTITNNTEELAEDLRLSVTVGKGDSPSGIVDAPTIEPLDAGASQSYEIPVTLDALSFGGYTIAAELNRESDPAIVRGTTSSYPWGLFALVAIGAQIFLLMVRNRIRNRLEEQDWEDIRIHDHAGELAPVAALPPGPPIPDEEPDTEWAEPEEIELASDGAEEEEYLRAMQGAFDLARSIHATGIDAIAQQRLVAREVLADVEREVTESLDEMCRSIDEQRTMTLDTLQVARDRAASIVADAESRAADILAQAKATRELASEELERSRSEAERLIDSAERDVSQRVAEVELTAMSLLEEAQRRSEAIAASAEHRLVSLARAADEQAVQMVTETATSISRRIVDQQPDADAGLLPLPTGTPANGATDAEDDDTDILEAVQRALQG